MDEATSEKILYRLKVGGPATAADLGARFGLTTMAIRQHLGRQVRAGLVAYEDEKGGVGRPKRVWRLTEQGHGRFPDRHADLTLELISSVRDLFGEEGLEKLIAAREAHAEEAYTDRLEGAAGLDEKLERLAEIRSEEGYMAEVRPDKEGFLLVEHHCPICAAAETCQGFCRAELDLFRMVLGPDVEVERTEHLLSGARRCAYRVTGKG